MTTSEAAKLVALFKAHADHNQHGPELVEMWALAMDDIPYAAAMVAYKHWIRTRKWFPKPSEIRELVNEKVFGIPSVETARAQAERSLRENYPGHTVRFAPDRLVIEAMRTVGGTHVFRNAQNSRELAVLWERFAFVYGELRTERLEAIDYTAEFAAIAEGRAENVCAIETGHVA